jgi:hypothetical protein
MKELKPGDRVKIYGIAHVRKMSSLPYLRGTKATIIHKMSDDEYIGLDDDGTEYEFHLNQARLLKKKKRRRFWIKIDKSYPNSLWIFPYKTPPESTEHFEVVELVEVKKK